MVRLILCEHPLTPILQTTGQEQAAKAQKAADERIANLMKAIRTYLPSIARGRTSDYLVHPTTLAHLRRRFNYVCSSLLRNDSLTDMSDRSVLYFELFEWLQVRQRWLSPWIPLNPLLPRQYHVMKPWPA